MNKYLVAGIISTILLGCGPKSNKPGLNVPAGPTDPKAVYGSLSISLTDAPFPFDIVQSARVVLGKVEIRNDKGEYLQVFESEEELDLINLRNGVTKSLVKIDLPVGVYDQVRLSIGKGIVELKDGRKFPVKVPSGETGGLKVPVSPEIEVISSLSSDLLLDIDVSKSFVAIGGVNSRNGITGFNFKPVARASNLSKSGTLKGIVFHDNGTPDDETDDSTLSGAVVEVSSEGKTVASTVTELDGSYSLIGIHASNYSVKISAEGFNSKRVENVKVAVSNSTELKETITKTPPPILVFTRDFKNSSFGAGEYEYGNEWFGPEGLTLSEGGGFDSDLKKMAPTLNSNKIYTARYYIENHSGDFSFGHYGESPNRLKDLFSPRELSDSVGWYVEEKITVQDLNQSWFGIWHDDGEGSVTISKIEFYEEKTEMPEIIKPVKNLVGVAGSDKTVSLSWDTSDYKYSPVTYQISVRIGHMGNYKEIGTTPETLFVDPTVYSSGTYVSYQVVVSAISAPEGWAIQRYGTGISVLIP